MQKRSALRAGSLGFLGLAALVIMAGCATIIHGGDQQINISSTPEGAQVAIFNSAGQKIWSSNATPTVADLKRGAGFFQGASYKVEISKNGYKTESVLIESSLDTGWYLVGNLFVGGLLGWLIIDPASGAMWTLAPQNVTEPLPSAATAGNVTSANEIRVVLKQDINPKVFDSLRLVRVN